MQVTNIKRPQLFTEFFTELLLWNSEFLTYIKTTTKKVLDNVTSSFTNYTIKTIHEKKEEYKLLSKQSDNLFKSLPSSRKEFDEVQNKISILLKSQSHNG